MLSIGRIKGKGEYYLDLAREDYYLSGGEPPGQWWGKGAAAFSLGTVVEREQLRALFDGFSPQGEPLVQNAGKPTHRPGFDLTFSAPKSVSVLWSQSGEAARNDIQKAHQQALHEALRYLEDIAFIRRGKGGHRRTKASLVVATFPHGTSRSLDPLLHTHCLIVNVAIGQDGRTGAVSARTLYRNKMTAGAVYRAALADRLHALGLQCEPKRSWFELRGVPESLMNELSKRRRAILTRLSEMGAEGPKASAVAALDTRDPKKGFVPRSELFAMWKVIGQKHGFLPEAVYQPTPDLHAQISTLTQKVADAIEAITQVKNSFSERQLVRVTAEQSIADGHGAKGIPDTVREVLKTSEDIVRIQERAAQEEREKEHSQEHTKQDRASDSGKQQTKSSGPESTKHTESEQDTSGQKERARAEQFREAQKKRDAEPRYTTRSVLEAGKCVAEFVGWFAGLRRGVPRSIVEKTIKTLSGPRSPYMEELRHHARQLARAAARKPTAPIDRAAVKGLSPVTLTKEQADVVRYLTRIGGGGLRCIESTKSPEHLLALRAVREAYERAGYHVIAVTPPRKGVIELKGAAGFVEAKTLRGFEGWMNPSFLFQARHLAKEVAKGFVGIRTRHLKPFKPSRKTVVILEDAAWLGMIRLHKVMKAMARGRGVLIVTSFPELEFVLESGQSAQSHWQQRTADRRPPDISFQQDGNEEQKGRDNVHEKPDREQSDSSTTSASFARSKKRPLRPKLKRRELRLEL